MDVFSSATLLKRQEHWPTRTRVWKAIVKGSLSLAQLPFLGGSWFWKLVAGLVIIRPRRYPLSKLFISVTDFHLKFHWCSLFLSFFPPPKARGPLRIYFLLELMLVFLSLFLILCSSHWRKDWGGTGENMVTPFSWYLTERSALN